MSNNGHSGLFPYYHCQSVKYGCKCRFNAQKVHLAMQEYLKTFEPCDEAIELFNVVLGDYFNTQDKERLNAKYEIEKQIEKADERINKIQDEFADENINVQQFKEMMARYEGQKNDLIMQHASFTKVSPDFEKYVSYSTGLLQNLSYYYTTSLPSVQHKLIGLIFPEKLTFTGTVYQTTKINEAFSLICNIDKGFKENNPAIYAGQSYQVSS